MNHIPYIIRNYRPSDFDDYVKLYIESAKHTPEALISLFWQ